MQADPKAALFMMIVVDGIAVILTLGGLTVIALAARPRRTLIIASALCGSLCGLLIAAAPATAGTAVTSVLGLVLGGVAGVLVGLLLATLLSIGTGRLAFMGALGRWLSGILLPARWSLAAGKPPISVRDLAKRAFVTIAAATGGVVGTLIDFDTLGNTLLNVLQPMRLVALLVGTVVSVALVGPLHEYVVERGRHPSGPEGHPPLGQALSELWEHMSWRSAGRLLLTVVALMQLEFIYDSLHGSVEKGNAAVVAQIMLGGLTPGIVSYYWSAALQYDAPSIRASSWAPSLVLGMVMLFGYGLYVALLFTALGAAWMWPDGIDLSILVVLILAMALGIGAGFLVLLAMSGIAVAIYAWAGAYAIDRVRGFEPTPYILAALLVATLPQQLAVLALFRWVLHAPISLPDVLMLFPSTFFWVLGLWASGFPALVRRGIPVQGEVPAYGP